MNDYLALPTLVFSEPQAVKKMKVTDDLYVTLWDRWEVKEGDLALGQFINYFKKKYKLIPSAIIHHTTMIYNNMMSEYKKKIPFKCVITHSL